MRGEKIAHPYLGVQMENLTPELAKANNTDPNSPLNVPEVEGVLVVRVVPNSPAASAGLRRGDVILQIDKQQVTTGEQLQNLVENSRIGQTLQLKIQRGNQTQQIGVKAGELRSEAG